MSVVEDSIAEVPPDLIKNNGNGNGSSVKTMSAPERIAPVSTAPPKKRKKPVLLILLAVIVVAAVIATIYTIIASGYETTDDAYVEADVVTISPQVSALVKKVHVDDNQLVKQGDVLVELDPTDYEVALEQARATQAAMEGKLEQARSEIDSANASRDEEAASVDVAIANAANAAADYKRFTELSAKSPGAVSRQQMDSAIDAQQSNIAQVKVAQAKLAAKQAEIATAQATLVAAQGDLKKAVADVHKAEVNLGYCKIIAPESGKITRKNVEAGSYVQTGEQLFAIVPEDVYVIANFKETQLNRMRVGQSVKVKVDAYPDMDLHGHVDSIQSGTGSRFSMLPAENATGNYVKVVQRVPVKVVLDSVNTDQNRLLTPGMSVIPEVSLK